MAVAARDTLLAMPQSVFGVGFLFATPAGANATPMRFGALQDVSVDFSFDTKALYGSSQFALEQARGKGKIRSEERRVGKECVP